MVNAKALDEIQIQAPGIIICVKFHSKNQNSTHETRVGEKYFVCL